MGFALPLAITSAVVTVVDVDRINRRQHLGRILARVPVAGRQAGTSQGWRCHASPGRTTHPSRLRALSWTSHRVP
jgi:hypothetical protein